MKVCPTCNARVDEDAAICHACDHEFKDSTQRQPKKTMMGFPAIDEEAESDAGQEDKSKSTLFGIPAVDDEGQEQGPIKTEMVSSDELPLSDMNFGDDEEEDDSTRQVDAAAIGDALAQVSKNKEQGQSKQDTDSTRQVDAATVSDALAKAQSQTIQEDHQDSDGDPKSTAFGIPSMENEDEQKDAANAWGIAESSASDEIPSTQVIDPESLNLDTDQKTNTSDPTGGSSNPAKQRDANQYGTLMGMSLEEQSEESSKAGGAMHMGAAGEGEDEDGAQDGSTQALSPDQLAQFEEMDFGDASEPDSAPPSFQQPGRERQPTPAADDSADAGKFQLPKPGKSGDGEDLKTPETSPEKEKQNQKGGNKASFADRKSAPQSGVFRAAKKKKKEKKPKTRQRPDTRPPTGSSPQTGNLDDKGVTGTGTYSMSTNTGATSDSPFDKDGDDDANVSIGGVGGGGRTAFPAGSSKEEKKEKLRKAVKARKESAPNRDGKEDGGKPSKRATQADSDMLESPSTGPRFALGENKEQQADVPAEKEDTPFEEIEIDEPPAPEAEAKGGPGVTTGDEDLDSMPQQPELQTPPESAEAPKATANVDPGSDEISSNETSSNEIGSDMGASPVDSSASASPAPPSQSTARPEPEPAASPKTEQPSFGAEPAAEPAMPTGQSTPQQSPQASGPEAGQDATPAAPTEDEQDNTLEGVLSLFQKGFGVLAVLTMVAITSVTTVLAGFPAESAGQAVVAAPFVLALATVVVTLLPLARGLRSVAYMAIGIVALLGFGATFAVGMEPLMAIGQFAGGLLLFCAAGSPLLRKMVK